MVECPEFLKPYESAGKELLAQQCIKDIEFSGSTYQILVEDPIEHEEHWIFLQLDPNDNIKDAFCGCENEQEIGGCTHLYAAFFSLFKNGKPLHKRFQRSIWNLLCRIYSSVFQEEQNLSQISKGIYSLEEAERKFLIHAKNDQIVDELETILEYRLRETEETSIKFSNLNKEEIREWKEGKPNEELRYQLSFWGDLAKWLLLKQEQEDSIQISFTYDSQNIPNKIEAVFPQFTVSFAVKQEDLPIIIPGLAFVNSPLKVYPIDPENFISISYDETKRELKIQKRKKNVEIEKEGKEFGEWVYIPQEGFFQKKMLADIEEKIISSEEIPLFIDQHITLLKKTLQGYKLYTKPLTAKYQLHFDSSWNLHVLLYLFNPGDLQIATNHLFSHWVFLQKKGFYLIEGKHFEKEELIINEKEMPEFIAANRIWLNSQPGFQTHLASIETHLTFSLVSSKLIFSYQLSTDKEVKEFDSWVYVKGEGFYSKIHPSLSYSIADGTQINQEKIPLFIRMNRDELATIKGFFAEKSPLIKIGLKICLTGDEAITVTPDLILRKGIKSEDLQIFDDFIYGEKYGFFEIPAEMRLPEKFRFPIKIPKDKTVPFVRDELEDIQKYITQIDQRLKKAQTFSLKAKKFEKDENRGSGWFLCELFYSHEDKKIPVADLWALVKKNIKYAFTEIGLLDLEDYRFNWLRRITRTDVNRKQNLISLSTMEFIRLISLESLEIDAKDLEGNKLFKEFSDLKIPEKPDYSTLKSSLRPYQEIGVEWLWFLYHQRVSGLLCDDMGLGKTHQAMALLSAVKAKNKEKVQFLVICPTSVIHHWEEKLEKYLPEMRVFLFYGSQRAIDRFDSTYDVFLTSYGIWRNEWRSLSKYSFEIAIFDEMQIAKNPNSLVHDRLIKVRAKMKLGLTGTPIENHLWELKALFDIILPGYMPTEREYWKYFLQPIEKEGNKEKKDLLSRFIHPFSLRRKKAEVLKDLPEKVEEISHCDLSQDQEGLYEEILLQGRTRLMEELQDSANPIPYIHIFALLSSLKQICNHPAAFLKQPQEFENYSSGKWDLFLELLQEARDSNQKVVIFTQYLAMLDIFEEYMQKHHIGYASVRGATQNRGEQVRKFNKDPKCEVFLGSLQAAGWGIDLTAASVVIHYDRWWNAARENQATDRVHRIGQTKNVQVFKLVTKGTFEEKIDKMILRKGKLMDIVAADDHNLLRKFDRNELIELLNFAKMSSGEDT